MREGDIKIGVLFFTFLTFNKQNGGVPCTESIRVGAGGEVADLILRQLRLKRVNEEKPWGGEQV
jgi:hypothetical protein